MIYDFCFIGLIFAFVFMIGVKLGAEITNTNKL